MQSKFKSLLMASLTFLSLTAPQAQAAFTKNLQYLVLYDGSFIANPEFTAHEICPKERTRFLITAAAINPTQPQYVDLYLTNRETGMRSKVSWYEGSESQANLLLSILLGEKQVTLYDPISTGSYHMLKIGFQGTDTVMPLTQFFRILRKEQAREQVLKTGHYGCHWMQRWFDWYYGVGVFKRK